MGGIRHEHRVTINTEAREELHGTDYSMGENKREDEINKEENIRTNINLRTNNDRKWKTHKKTPRKKIIWNSNNRE